MFASEIVTQDGKPPVLKLTSPQTIAGGVNAVVAALTPHEDAERVIMDFSLLQTVEAGCGMALVMFLQRRGSKPVKTRVFGIDPTVRRTFWRECFMFVEAKEMAASYDEALEKASA